ncbi:hypothetical protein [Thermosulfurimonas dismutans]|uniref:Uncharacterized protein n=1 Tax=Thermosulfurimonas dismutans TaxID=999894 RepID=A0A179D6I1_9BACT|nr:hypothetical protein [Thermosulfurimonas dismutans]OAQ21715.1 hypothetical protein TDIS_0233 [Thermosulfurimonas dismutans]
MQRLPLNYLKPGMITAEEVKDEKGRVLCPTGTKISPELLERFSRMGVQFVTVKGRPVNFPWEKSLEEELSELEKRFSQAKHPFLVELKESLKEFLSAQFSEAQENVG